MNNLSQADADFLIAIEKAFINPHAFRLSSQGQSKTYPLKEVVSGKTDLFMSMHRGAKNPQKCTYQILYKTNILMRVDIGFSGKHYNPDNTVIESYTPHIHIYTAEHGDHFAVPLPASFTDPNNFIRVLYNFFDYSRIINGNEIKICIQGGLFHDS